MSFIKRNWFYLILIILVAAIAYSYTWTFTPYGRLDYRAALTLHLLTFEQTVRPDPNSDFELALPANLAYALEMIKPKEAVARTEDVVISGSEGDIPVRVYWPSGVDAMSSAPPVVVYYHGGGFVVGDLEIFDPVARSLSNTAKAIVVSVDYRLAPAHPFPAAVDDAYAALLWAGENAFDLGGNPLKLVTVGDSAGGNLATVVSLKARDEGGPHIAAQLLYYPAVDLTEASYESEDHFSDGYGLSQKAMDSFHEAYVGHLTQEELADPYLSPLYAPSLEGLPPALIVIGGFDPLHDSVHAYAARLEQSGVPVTLRDYPKMVHGFLGVSLFPQRREALDDAAAFLDAVFGSSVAA